MIRRMQPNDEWLIVMVPLQLAVIGVRLLVVFGGFVGSLALACGDCVADTTARPC